MQSLDADLHATLELLRLTFGSTEWVVVFRIKGGTIAGLIWLIFNLLFDNWPSSRSVDVSIMKFC